MDAVCQNCVLSISGRCLPNLCLTLYPWTLFANRGEIDRVYGVRYTRRDFSVAERPEGYLGPRSGMIKYKCGVKRNWSGAERLGAEWDIIRAARSAVERGWKVSERCKAQRSGVKKYYCGLKIIGALRSAVERDEKI